MRLLHGLGELFRQNRSLDELIVVALPVQLETDVGHLVEASASRQREGSFQSRTLGPASSTLVPARSPLADVGKSLGILFVLVGQLVEVFGRSLV
jgi:hypothetical protein